ncbi:MAG: leucine-rich repeat protein [Bacilli bacterium]|nr:leucine-rich repeat protein [Bacilli bacterium]
MRKILKITSLLIVVLVCLFNINIKAEESSEVQKYEVTYILNGGEFASEPETTVETGYILPVPTRDGYVFQGWYLAEQKVVAVNATGTYVAKWLVLDCGDHKLVDHAGKEAKCEEIGWQAYQTCEKCCYTTYVEIPELRHNYEGSACLNCGEKVSAGLKYEIVEGIISVDGKVIVSTNNYESHEALVADFMKDLNTHCGTEGDFNLNTFTSKFGNHMYNANSDSFVNDEAMWAKWSWLFEYISLKMNYYFDMVNKMPSSPFMWKIYVREFLAQRIRNGVNWAIVDEYYNIPKKAVLSGMGTCTDKDVIIQKEYKGLVVTEILPGTFAGNTDITSVTIASGITSIDANEFLGCTSLEAINVDVKNETYKSVDGVLYSVDGKTLLAYPAGKKAESFVTPEGVTSINNNAFNSCKNLKSITLSEGVKSLGAFAFSGCENLETLSLPSTLSNFNQYAFNGCPEIKDVYYAKTLARFLTTNTNEKTRNPISVAKKFYLLDENNEYYYLTEVVIPSGISWYSGYYKFYGYEGLTKVTYEENTKTKYVYNYMFEGCVNLEEVILAEGIEYIYGSAFKGCINLKEITIPKSVKGISISAFSNCTSLKNVNFEEGSVLSYIEQSAFSRCTSLETITLPESLTSLYLNAFSVCANLKSVYIPLSVSDARLDQSVFSVCPNLTIYCEAEAKPDTWADNWNGICPVVWGYCIHKLEEHAGKVEDCENIGWEAYVTCSKCDYTTYKEIPATGHTYDEWTVVDAAKCEAEGLERRDCANCDHFETQPIAATGHVMGEWYVVEPAKCEAEGLEQKDCANCDHFETQPIAATGHAMGEWYVVKEASTQVEGLKQKDCANCDHFETEAIRKVTFADLIERGMTAIGNIFDSIGNIFGSTSDMAGSVSDALNLDQVAKSFSSFIQSIFAMDDEEEQKESLYEYIFG